MITIEIFLAILNGILIGLGVVFIFCVLIFLAIYILDKITGKELDRREALRNETLSPAFFQDMEDKGIICWWEDFSGMPFSVNYSIPDEENDRYYHGQICMRENIEKDVRRDLNTLLDNIKNQSTI